MSNPAAVNSGYSGRSGLGSLFHSVRLAAGLLFYQVQCFVLSHRQPMALVFALIRRLRPIAIVGPLGCATKAKDVREVLDRLADFSQAEELGPKIPWGPFMVIIDWPEQHLRERALLQSVVNGPVDLDQIRTQAAATCLEKIPPAGNGERKPFDVVKQLCEPVVIEIVQNYLGIRSSDSNPDEMAQLLGRVAGFIMVEPPEGSERWNRSLDSIDMLTRLIVERIRAERSAPTTTAFKDLLARLLVKLGDLERRGECPPWLDENWIRRYITGLAVFGGGTIVRATAQAIDQLLRYPDHLRAAQEAAKTLDREMERLKAAGLPPADMQQRVEVARERLQHYIYEALRFRPMLPVLNRYVPRETVLAKDTAHARLVPAGVTMLAPPLAAMFDPDEFPHPWRFDPTRSLSKYVHFGFGPRLCFGKYIADALMLEIFRALLIREDIKRAPGSDGRIAYDGPAVRSLSLTFK